eukprot:TRINITY_DN7337_c0_g1_i2.p1 TRINITY_DN7337_c0_g1~~TRINITY_DN7337_c0_g1_i2.p1  ORF type:complete len:379 (+),score=48.76 TRINITY_DN7337_c0_g1_i2:65-1201(+)
MMGWATYFHPGLQAWLVHISLIILSLTQTVAMHNTLWAGKKALQQQEANPDGLYYEAFSVDCRVPEILPVSDDRAGPIHVVYASNREGMSELFVSAASVIRNLAKPQEGVLHIIVPEEAMDEARRLVGCLSHEFPETALPSVLLHKEKPLPFEYKSTNGVVKTWEKEITAESVAKGDEEHIQEKIERFENSTFTVPSAAARLILNEYLPNESRAIWLDIDTIVNDDLAQLYHMKMAHAVAAAAGARPGFTSMSLLSKGLAESANVTSDNFFNSGVLLIDLEKWQTQNLTEKVASWGKTLGWDVGDQAALNFALGGEYDHLDMRWNMHCLGHYQLPQPCVESGHIFHFNCPDPDHGPNSDLRSRMLTSSKCDLSVEPSS